MFAPIPAARCHAIAEHVQGLLKVLNYIVPSHDIGTAGYEPQRYWRGPVWLVTNYMIADGLRNAGELAVADRIARSSLELITKSGFAEYYDPKTGEPLGGGRFTWTAAMVIEFLRAQEAELA